MVQATDSAVTGYTGGGKRYIAIRAYFYTSVAACWSEATAVVVAADALQPMQLLPLLLCPCIPDTKKQEAEGAVVSDAASTGRGFYSVRGSFCLALPVCTNFSAK